MQVALLFLKQKKRRPFFARYSWNCFLSLGTSARNEVFLSCCWLFCLGKFPPWLVVNALRHSDKTALRCSVFYSNFACGLKLKETRPEEQPNPGTRSVWTSDVSCRKTWPVRWTRQIWCFKKSSSVAFVSFIWKPMFRHAGSNSFLRMPFKSHS